MKQKQRAEELIALFNLAGWKTNLTNVPLEANIHRYFEGIEVLGHNSAFVNMIAQDLRVAGLDGVRENIAAINIAPGNPKWPHTQHTVQITVGH